NRQCADLRARGLSRPGPCAGPPRRNGSTDCGAPGQPRRADDHAGGGRRAGDVPCHAHLGSGRQPPPPRSRGTTGPRPRRPPSAVGEWMLLVAYSLFFLILLGFTVLTLLWIFQR